MVNLWLRLLWIKLRLLLRVRRGDLLLGLLVSIEQGLLSGSNTFCLLLQTVQLLQVLLLLREHVGNV